MTMLLFRIIRKLLVFLLLTKTIQSSSTLDILIQRIRNVAGANTVCLFGSSKYQLEDIFTKFVNFPVVVFTSSVPKDFNPKINFSKNILLLPVDKNNEGERKHLEKVMQNLIAQKFAVIVFGSNVNQLEGYFAWLVERKFSRIFGVVGNRTFTYFPYAVNKFQPVPADGPLPDVMRDLNGFNFRTNVQMDAPRAFFYKDKNGRRKVAGYAAEMFFTFIRKHNARYTEVILNTSLTYDMPRIIKATTGGEIDLSMNPYINMPAFQQSYPFRYLHWNVLIPHNGFVDPNQYFTRPFTLGVWMSIAGLTVYITLMNIALDFCLLLELDLWHSFSRTFCTFLYTSSERRIKQAFRFHAQVLVMAFILYNLYCVHLTSFLTVFINADQSYTLQDLVDNQIRILMIDTEIEILELPDLPQGFINIITGVPINELNTHRYSARNKSFAYAAPSDKAAYILSQQVKLSLPNFHISSDSMSDTSFGFILPKESPFVDILSMHVLQQIQMGLMLKSESEAIYQGREAGILHLIEHETERSVAFNLRHLSFAWNCLGIGLAGASVVFLAEKSASRVLKCFHKQN